MTSLISAVFGDKSKDDDTTKSKEENNTESKDDNATESKDNTTTESSDASPETKREAADSAQSDQTTAGGSQAEVKQPKKMYELPKQNPPPGTIPCPDPSVHSRDTRLQEQASNAALYTTSPWKKTNPRGNILGPDQKLSSASESIAVNHTLRRC